MKKDLRYKLSIIIAFLMLMAISCENFQEDPNNRFNDSVGIIDTLPKIDTCIGDSCYTCNLSDGAEVIYDQFMDAYYNDSPSDLEQLLRVWEFSYVPDLYVPDSLMDIYAVYKEFYSPWDLDRIADSEFGNDLYKGIYYYLIQSSIRYDHSFNANESQRYTIEEFLPPINNDTIHILYLTEKYESAINCFLGTSYVPVDTANTFTPEYPSVDLFQRSRFIGNYLQFFTGHWGNYYHLETHPEVENISFNEKQDSARVYFRVGYQGGEAVLGKKDDRWVIADHYMTWIE